MNLPDHGNDITWDEFSSLNHFQKHLVWSVATVNGWPVWPRSAPRDCGKAQWEDPRVVDECYVQGTKSTHGLRQGIPYYSSEVRV